MEESVFEGTPEVRPVLEGVPALSVRLFLVGFPLVVIPIFEDDFSLLHNSKVI